MTNSVLKIEQVVSALRMASADTGILGVRVSKEHIKMILAHLPSHDDSDPGLALFSQLVAEAKDRAKKAMVKYPQPNYVLTKFGEESGEVTKECVHYLEGRGNWDFVKYEMVDVLAMMIRLLVEGDQVHGFIPPYLKEGNDNGKQ